MKNPFKKCEIDFKLERNGPGFASVVRNIDLNAISNAQADSIRHLLYQEKVLIFKNQKLKIPAYIKFAKQFGSLIPFVDKEYHHPKHPEVFVVSNIKVNGERFGMGRVGYYWHSDSSFLNTPQPITMLNAQMVPDEGGETAFIDMGAVYKSLPTDVKEKTSTLCAIHEGQWKYIVTEKDLGLSIDEILERDRKEVPPVLHPMVNFHPHTKQASLYVNEGFATGIDGLPKSEATELLKYFFDTTASHPSKYVHKWEVGDIVIWDNRSLVHRAFPSKKGNRVLFRIGIRDGAFFGLKKIGGNK